MTVSKARYDMLMAQVEKDRKALLRASEIASKLADREDNDSLRIESGQFWRHAIEIERMVSANLSRFAK